MPVLLAALPILLPALGAAATAGTLASTGLNIANTISGPGAPATPAAAAPKPPDAQELLQKRELISQQIPNLISSGSGTLSPEFIQLMASLNSGVLGTPGANAAGQAATEQQFTPANSQATNAVVNGQNPSLSDFLSSFSG